MSPLTFFFRAVARSSAIFIGAAVVMLHPSLEWRSAASHDLTVAAQPAASEAAIDGLIAALRDPDSGVRRQVVHALAQLRNSRAVPELIGAIGDQDAAVRAGAARALGQIGDARALGPLTRALKDDNVSVRRAAASAIAELAVPAGP